MVYTIVKNGTAEVLVHKDFRLLCVFKRRLHAQRYFASHPDIHDTHEILAIESFPFVESQKHGIESNPYFP